MLKSIFVCIFLLPILISSQTTNFVQLIGYSIVSEISETIASSNLMDCLGLCVDATPTLCIGVNFDGSQCSLFIQIRNIIENATACNHYVYDRRNSTAGSMSLSEIDQLIYFDAFLSSTCPQGYEQKDYGCSIEISNAKCQEYATFFNAIISPNTSNSEECITDIKAGLCYPYDSILGGPWKYSENGTTYCYYNVSALANQTMNYYVSTCQTVSSRSNVISVCSNMENNFVKTNQFTELFFGLYIPLSKPWALENFEWTDGCNCTFRRWSGGEPNGNKTGAEERFTGMSSNWFDFAFWKHPNVFCKEKGITIVEYYNIFHRRYPFFYKLFDAFKNEIKYLFQFGENLVNEVKQVGEDLFRNDTSHKLCIHFRRGDFLSTRFYASSAEFINPAAEEIYFYLQNQKVSDISVILFGQDEAFVKTLNFEKALFFDVYRPKLTSRDHDLAFAHQFCDSFLISSSGSTFGWWIAYLLPESIPIFYNGMIQRRGRNFNEDEIDEFYPKYWKRINFENDTVSLMRDDNQLEDFPL